jgi:hypothetical protein
MFLKKVFKNISKKGVLLLITIPIVSCLIIAGYFLMQERYTSIIKPKKVSFAKIADQIAYDKWSELIKRIGGEKAYSEFKKDAKSKQVRDRHYQAHLFGEALYNNEGPKGIFVCDNEFDSGCYHSFLSLAIETEGLNVVPDLSRKCSEHLTQDSGGCQHGIGHGILTSVGYDFTSLNKSIGVCNDLEINESTKNCLNGVFMEYNFQTMLLDKGKLRTFEESNPYFPCFTVDESARGVCIYQQAQWWAASIKKNMQEKTKKIDTLCSESGNLKYQCFIGFGVKLIAYLNYDAKQAEYFCNRLTDPAGKGLCQSGVRRNLPL